MLREIPDLHPGIYSSSFTSDCFWKKIEFSNNEKWRWGSRGAVSSTTGSRRTPFQDGGKGGKAPEKFWSFYIWRTNK